MTLKAVAVMAISRLTRLENSCPKNPIMGPLSSAKNLIAYLAALLFRCRFKKKFE
jgi:hypothetical protein